MGAFADVALSHRWNFNDSDYTDSVGGSANGSAFGGTNPSFANGQVTFPGTGWGSGSVDLGKSLTDGGDTTIEIWAKNNVLSAAEIMFEYGAPNNNYGGWGGSKQCFAYYWSDEDAQGNDIFIVKKGNYTSHSSKSGIMPATVGTMYHFSLTFKADGNGGTVVNFARRNATTGALEASGTHTVPDWTLSHLESQTPSFSLNISKEPQYKPAANAYNGPKSRYSDSNATYDEVRIWKGALSEDQLTANVLMGVDAPPTAGITVSGATGCTLAAGERFTIKGGGASIVGSVTLSSTSAIVFDTSSCDGLEMSFTAQGGFSTPGNASILDFVSVTDTSRWSSPVLSADGKTITVSSTSFPYTWTGAVNSNWTEPGNWKQGSAVATTAPGGDDRVEFVNDSAVTVTLDSDATVSNVVFAGSAAVTLANPNAASTNTLTVTRFVNSGSAEAAIECKVAFTGTYDVRQSAAVRFTGGATASVPEPELRTTYETELNRTFYGNVTFTSDITVAGLVGMEKPWIVPSGSVVNGQAIAGTQGGHGRILLVEQGGVANFTSLTMGWDTGDFEIHGELNVSGTVTHVCHNGARGWSSNCFRESNTGVVRMNGFYKQHGDVDDVGVETMVIGSGGISYSGIGWPIRFAHNSTIRAAADFGIQNAEAYSSGDTDDHGLLFNGYTVTFNTEGEDGVAHTVTLGSSIRNAAGVLRKTGAGTLILQDGDRDTNTGWTKKYTGGTMIEAGTVQVLDNGQLGSGAIAVNGGILEIGEGVTSAPAVALAEGTTLTVDVTERSEAAAVALTATGGATVKVKGTLAPGALRNGVTLADSCDDATLTNLTLDASQINNGRLKLAVKDGKLILGVRKGLTIVIR